MSRYRTSELCRHASLPAGTSVVRVHTRFRWRRLPKWLATVIRRTLDLSIEVTVSPAVVVHGNATPTSTACCRPTPRPSVN